MDQFCFINTLTTSDVDKIRELIESKIQINTNFMKWVLAKPEPGLDATPNEKDMTSSAVKKGLENIYLTEILSKL